MSKRLPAADGRRLDVQKFVASVGGLGYVLNKGGATLAATVAALLLYGVTLLTPVSPWGFLAVTLVLTVLGIWSGNGVEAVWGEDSHKAVLDEVVGMYVAVLFHPLGWERILEGLILFRVFDIWKPLGIRKTEALPGGWGVMTDDIVAGIYANLVLCLLEWLHI